MENQNENQINVGKLEGRIYDYVYNLTNEQKNKFLLGSIAVAGIMLLGVCGKMSLMLVEDIKKHNERVIKMDNYIIEQPTNQLNSNKYLTSKLVDFEVDSEVIGTRLNCHYGIPLNLKVKDFINQDFKPDSFTYNGKNIKHSDLIDLPDFVLDKMNYTCLKGFKKQFL